MGQEAPRVCTDEPDIQRLLALIPELPAHGHVVLHMRDGSTRTGIVSVRSSAQVFRDPQRREGLNGVVSLEDAAVRGRIQRIWLDQVARVEHLDSGLAAEN